MSKREKDTINQTKDEEEREKREELLRLAAEEEKAKEAEVKLDAKGKPIPVQKKEDEVVEEKKDEGEKQIGPKVKLGDWTLGKFNKME